MIFRLRMADTVLMIRSGLFRFILSFLHIVYSRLQYFDIAWAFFRRKFQEILPLNRGDSQSYVSCFVTKLEKCPNHFAIITGSETVKFEDFSNLIVWCLAAGISFITFYDHTGYLKNNEELYFKYLFSKKKLDKNYVIFNENGNGTKNGYRKNGFTKKINVNIFSLEDGKELFSKLVCKLCERALGNEIKGRDIDEGYVDGEILKMMNGLRDPDLAVICGKICSPFGFLPWHIRLTEFLQVPSLENMQVSEFTAILKRYSDCKQRYGR